MLTIREAMNEDIRGLGYLFEEVTGEKVEMKKIERVFTSIQNDESYQLLVAEKDGEIVGSIMGVLCYDFLKGCKPFMVIKNSIIAQSNREQGIEGALREKIEVIARNNQVSEILEEK